MSTFRVVYLPTNQRYCIAWGSADPAEMQLLRVDNPAIDPDAKLFFETREEAQAVLDKLEEA